MTMFQWKASDFVLVGKKLKFYLFGKTFVADFVFNVFMTNFLVQAASNHAFKISILYCFNLKDCKKWTIWGQLKAFNNPLQLLLHCVCDNVANLRHFFLYTVSRCIEFSFCYLNFQVDADTVVKFIF